MSQSLRQRRIERAEELAAQYPFAAEVLRFFVPVARFQDESYGSGEKALKTQEQSISFAQPLAAGVVDRFPGFLSWSRKSVPARLRQPLASCRVGLRTVSANC